jgi:hypothetical protein
VSDVLIRDVPADDLADLRAAAAAADQSLQGYLRVVMQAQADYVRRQRSLAAVEQRLAGRQPLHEGELHAAIDDLDDEIETGTEEWAVRRDR